MQKVGKATVEAKELGSYPQEYKGFNVEYSIGKGRASKIPFISILGNGQRTKKGIYPVFLYYREFKTLILAYGISADTNPDLKWGQFQHSPMQIGKYFSNKWPDMKKEEYSESLVFKVYDLSKTNALAKVDGDLEKISKEYRQVLKGDILPGKPEKASFKGKSSNELLSFEYQSFSLFAARQGLLFDDDLVLRFAASLLAKPFVILLGLSGSGKTKLAVTFAKWIAKSEDQYKIIPVGPDWTNRDPLLGFPDALNPKEYRKPENKVLDLLEAAAMNPSLPYFLILDEMNLSHVERYFADFLSAIELDGNDRSISLHSTDTISTVPSKIELPRNLFIIGTVNIDETTYMFSPKVLDRANAIEFRIGHQQMQEFLLDGERGNSGNPHKNGEKMAVDFLKRGLGPAELGENHKKHLGEALIHFFKMLQPVGAEFGYRSATEMLRFAAIVYGLDSSKLENLNWILDAAIMQKLLPKLHGSRRKLAGVLEKLAGLCWVDGSLTLEGMHKDDDQGKYLTPEVCKYPVSLEKLNRMYSNLMDNGFTSYAEA